MSNNHYKNSENGKGYYIALILCAVAIGISGYLYYRNANNETKDPGQSVLSTDPVPGNIQVDATLPTAESTQNTVPSGTAPTEPAKKPSKIRQPVSGETVASYAMDALSYNQTTRDWRTHNGIDIAAKEGSAVCAAADGTVYTVYEDESMGTTVVIRHDGGYTTRYASLAETVTVKPGEKVTAGQAIGAVANTALLESALGDHLHFSVTCDSKPMDPAKFLEMK